jgi:hypothetical protein
VKAMWPRLSVSFALALLCACAAGTTTGEPSTGAVGAFGADALTASCGSALFDGLAPDTSSLEPFRSFDELDMSDVGGEAPYFRDFVSRYDWFTTQQGDDRRDLFGAPAGTHLDPPYAYARVELHDGKWAPVGWGQCNVELDAKGWGNASFRIDPKTPPDPSSDRILVRATENACASGEPPTGRDVHAVILDENANLVSIVILVEPTSGAADCPSNPSFPFEVQLGAPLGDRKILDASVYPASQRWPVVRPGSDTG